MTITITEDELQTIINSVGIHAIHGEKTLPKFTLDRLQKIQEKLLHQLYQYQESKSL